VLLPRGVRSRSRTSSRVPGGTDELDDRAPEQCHRHGVPVVLVQVLHLDHCRHAVSVSAAPPAAHRADSHIRRTDRLNPRTNDRLTRIHRSADGAKKKAPKPHPQPLGHGRQARQHAHRSTSSGRCGSRHLTVRRPIITADIAPPHCGGRLRSVMRWASSCRGGPAAALSSYQRSAQRGLPDVQTWPERLARSSPASSSAARWSAGRVRCAYTLSVIDPPPAWPRRPATVRRSIPAASIWVAL
jgi:hypothetical protein